MDQLLPSYKEKKKIREIVELGQDFNPSEYSISAVSSILVDFLKELPGPLLTDVVGILIIIVYSHKLLFNSTKLINVSLPPLSPPSSLTILSPWIQKTL